MSFSDNFKREEFVGDGATTVFTVANSYAAGSVDVWVAGIMQPRTESNPSTGQVTLGVAPLLNAVIIITYEVPYILSQAVVEDDGGYRLSLTGGFDGVPAQVLINNIPCYSGFSGQGYSPVPRNNLLRFASPPISRGGPYDLKVVLNGGSTTLTAAITVVARNWQTKTFALKRVLPPWYKMGPRNLDSVALLV